jgi:hypothetical protein
MIDPNVAYGNVECGINRNRFRGSHSGSILGAEKPSRRWFVDVTHFGLVDVSTRGLLGHPR